MQIQLSNSTIRICFHPSLCDCFSRYSHNYLLLSLVNTAASLKSSRNSVAQSLRFNKHHLTQLGSVGRAQSRWNLKCTWEVRKGLGLGCREWPYFDFNSRSADIHSNLHLKSDLYYIDPSLQRNDRSSPSRFLPN